MKTIKIIQRFFNKSEAHSHAAYQRQKAKKDGVQLDEVEVVAAYDLYKSNGWFRKKPFKQLGIPAPEQYMVIIKYAVASVQVEKVHVIKKKINKAKCTNTIIKSFIIVKISSLVATHKKIFWLSYALNMTSTISPKYINSTALKFSYNFSASATTAA